jgi:hypothetical protein
MVIEQNAMRSEHIWDRLFASQKGAGHTGGFYREVISGTMTSFEGATRNRNHAP